LQSNKRTIKLVLSLAPYLHTGSAFSRHEITFNLETFEVLVRLPLEAITSLRAGAGHPQVLQWQDFRNGKT
jgi:hypothetical protein